MERNGKGEEYYNNGNLLFKGEYLNGKRWNGIGYDIFGYEEFEITLKLKLMKEKDGENNIMEMVKYNMKVNI